MTQPIRLLVADVRAAAIQAYREHRLSAQGPTPECAYRDASGLPCVIGAAMTDEEHAGIEEISVLSLLDRRFIETDDIDTLIELQTAHDSWANPKFQQSTRAQGHRDLCALLGIEDE